MSLCLGIDLSTRRVDLAAIPLDPDNTVEPQCFHFNVPRLGSPKDTSRPVDLQKTGRLMRDVFSFINADYRFAIDPARWRMHVSTVCIETPAGRVHPNLQSLYGALQASIPASVTVATIYPVQWRQALGLTGRNKNNKAAGLARVLELYPMCTEWDEHQLDSLGIAHAWRTIQWETTAA